MMNSNNIVKTLFVLFFFVGIGKIKSENTVLDTEKKARDALASLTKKCIPILEQFDTFANHIQKALDHKKINTYEASVIFSALRFAANKHKDQTRKGPDKLPYIIHPIGVANIIFSIGNICDQKIIIGALLHDTIEDTNTTYEELEKSFGNAIKSLVNELTDDKSLPKEKRKALQVSNAPHKTKEACAIKLADMIYNLNDLKNNPPSDWSDERKNQYFTWAENVLLNLPKDHHEPLRTHMIKLIDAHKNNSSAMKETE